MIPSMSWSLAATALVLLPGVLAASQDNATFPDIDSLRAQLALMGDDRPEKCPPWYGYSKQIAPFGDIKLTLPLASTVCLTPILAHSTPTATRSTVFATAQLVSAAMTA